MSVKEGTGFDAVDAHLGAEALGERDGHRFQSGFGRRVRNDVGASAARRRRLLTLMIDPPSPSAMRCR